MINADAVVVGAGPNGLVAANALADTGWDVVLVEAKDEVGGAVRSAEVTAPGYVTDLFSAFYPLAAATPIIRDLHLEEHGLVALTPGRSASVSPRLGFMSCASSSSSRTDTPPSTSADWRLVPVMTIS